MCFFELQNGPGQILNSAEIFSHPIFIHPVPCHTPGRTIQNGTVFYKLLNKQIQKIDRMVTSSYLLTGSATPNFCYDSFLPSLMLNMLFSFPHYYLHALFHRHMLDFLFHFHFNMWLTSLFHTRG